MEDKRIAAQKRAAEYNRKMIGQLYRHFKGDFYRVLFVAVHSETAELLVIYCKPEDTTKVWARPLLRPCFFMALNSFGLILWHHWSARSPIWRDS